MVTHLGPLTVWWPLIGQRFAPPGCRNPLRYIDYDSKRHRRLGSCRAASQPLTDDGQTVGIDLAARGYGSVAQGFTISGVTNSSAIYARTDASGDVTKLHHEIPEVRASMLSGGATHGHGDGRQSPRASHLMTAKSPGRRLHRLAAEFHRLASGR